MGFLSRKTVYSGSMHVDPALVRQWEEYAQISGKPVHIPGGADPTSYVKDQEKQGREEAKQFRLRISQELEGLQKAHKAKMDAKQQKEAKKEAEKRARQYMKRKFGWKK